MEMSDKRQEAWELFTTKYTSLANFLNEEQKYKNYNSAVMNALRAGHIVTSILLDNYDWESVIIIPKNYWSTYRYDIISKPSENEIGSSVSIFIADLGFYILRDIHRLERWLEGDRSRAVKLRALDDDFWGVHAALKSEFPEEAIKVIIEKVRNLFFTRSKSYRDVFVTQEVGAWFESYKYSGVFKKSGPPKERMSDDFWIFLIDTFLRNRHQYKTYYSQENFLSDIKINLSKKRQENIMFLQDATPTSITERGRMMWNALKENGLVGARSQSNRSKNLS